MMSQTSKYEATPQLASPRGEARRASFPVPRTSQKASQPARIVNEASELSIAQTHLTPNSPRFASSRLVAISANNCPPKFPPTSHRRLAFIPGKENKFVNSSLPRLKSTTHVEMSRFWLRKKQNKNEATSKEVNAVGRSRKVRRRHLGSTISVP